VLDDEALTAMRERAAAAGIEYEESDAGLLLRDPWNNAVVFTSSD
jgi:hypothetical protein